MVMTKLKLFSKKEIMDIAFSGRDISRTWSQEPGHTSDMKLFENNS